MVRTKKIWLMVVLLIIPILVCAQARPVRTAQGTGIIKGENNRKYDPATENTFVGIIREVIKKESENGTHTGVHLLVETKDELQDVHIAPLWYLDRQDISFKKGSMIIVIGSGITYKEKASIIARIIDFEGKKLTLRDEEGQPVWSGAAAEKK